MQSTETFFSFLNSESSPKATVPCFLATQMGRLYIPAPLYNGRINNSLSKGVLQVHCFTYLPLEERKGKPSVAQQMEFVWKSLSSQSGESYVYLSCSLHLSGVCTHRCAYGSVGTLDQ